MKTTINENIISSFLLDDKYRILRHVLLQIVILMITIGNFFDAPDKLSLTLNRFYGWIGYYLFLNMLVYFNAYVLYPRFLAKNKMFLYIVSVIIFTLFALFIMMILQEYFYDIAVIHQEPSAVAVFLSIASSLLAIILFLGGISAIMLFRQWISNNKRIVELESATMQSELSFLKSQINPHFLFNMINNANILVGEDPNMASRILIKLDDLLKYQFEDSTKDKVRLNADIAFLTDFLDLEKIRRDNFEYTVTKEGEIDNVEVAPLLFIPFVENATKHNLDSENLSYVHISFKVQNQQLIFICENSKPLRATKKEVGGIGLTNIRRRLNLLYGNNYALEINETDRTYMVNLQLKI